MEDAPSIDMETDRNVRYVVDQAKVRAYEVLGERPKAVAIMERQLLSGQADLGGC